MAKAPRRRGRRDSEDEKPRAVRPVRPGSAGEPPADGPPAVRPVKPAARPVKPVARPVKPVARPVKPVARPVKPVARPVKPVARPVKPASGQPPVAKPVAKPVGKPVARPVAKAVAQPIAKPVAKPVSPKQPGARKAPGKEGRAAPAARGRTKMAEEDVGRPRGRASARGGHGAGGMGLGAKVGLLAAAAAFVAIGAAVLLAGGSGGDDEDAQLNAYGLAAVSALSAPDAKWWRGVGPTTRNLQYFEKKFADLLGPAGAEYWTTRLAALTQPVSREDEGTFAGEKLKEDQERFQHALKKLEPSSSGPKNVVQARLSQVWNRMGSADRARYQVLAAWVRNVGSGGVGKWLAGNVRATEVRVDWATGAALGRGINAADGIVTDTPVRVFSAPIAGTKGAPALVGFVAVFDAGTSSGGAAMGLIMLILGPLLVGGIAFAVANAHTKNVRKLTREIDRLGSAGDATRDLHAHGAEATAVARSVERMVANLEFRSKHEGADLDDVVSREQQIAQEIHGSLSRKDPPRLSNYEVETLFKPGFEIGGDHFEYFNIDEDHLGIILLDTNVRGIPAALVMASARSYVRAEAPGILSPAELLKRVNRHLAGDLPAGRHVTALYVVLNTADGSATLASAGHLPLLVYRHQAGKMAKVNPEGIAMGLDAGPIFDEALQEGDIPIGLGDRLVLYTDGALKVQNGEGQEFGEQSFYATVTAEAPKNSQAFVNFVGAAIDRFHLEVPQNDDITISTIKRLR